MNYLLSNLQKYCYERNEQNIYGNNILLFFFIDGGAEIKQRFYKQGYIQVCSTEGLNLLNVSQPGGAFGIVGKPGYGNLDKGRNERDATMILGGMVGSQCTRSVTGKEEVCLNVRNNHVRAVGKGWRVMNGLVLARMLLFDISLLRMICCVSWL